MDATQPHKMHEEVLQGKKKKKINKEKNKQRERESNKINKIPKQGR